MYLMDKSDDLIINNDSNKSNIQVTHDHSHDHSRGNFELVDVKSASKNEVEVLACPQCNDLEASESDKQTIGHHSHHLTSHSDTISTHSIVKAVIMEISIAVHSIIIGFDYGTLGSSDSGTLRALIIAFVFHQFFEGISLGTAVVEVKGIKLSTVIVFSLIFALTLPFGVLLGTYTTQNASSETITGVCNALAAGSLIYTGLIEMIAEDFNNPDLKKNPLLKFQMYTALCFGSFCMALLAYWA
eukprot:CAMPEP_0196762366 /NCGR_PEP_ID=MMETSP1095-20130614/1785_1 /TAXON_ID=96789 ORGANISM="Chromulina nebulosa, Strain UTEXLB2642" /NCGR_SAMPLE_ID=MMETSP1095 /ASSEMBLY_ACC=CAM_ASM_000446 /LENGTH=242 /DNA_ID=CAMNT_0042113063 /DNA_START=49 /DNA_END=777 /DNA_ORIENTATION=-